MTQSPIVDCLEVLMMELIEFATNKGSVRAVQELIAKALAEAGRRDAALLIRRVVRGTGKESAAITPSEIITQARREIRFGAAIHNLLEGETCNGHAVFLLQPGIKTGRPFPRITGLTEMPAGSHGAGRPAAHADRAGLVDPAVSGRAGIQAGGGLATDGGCQASLAPGRCRVQSRKH